MQFEKRALSEVQWNPFTMIGDQWYLLTAGDATHYNTMTASWGFMGVMWGKPSFLCGVRTNRHTLSFLEENDCFSVSFFDETQRAALQFCGTHSGRDCDKAKETGLTPIEIEGVTAFAEAKLVLICKKQYTDLLKPEGFLLPETYEKWYHTDPMHKLFVGEILTAYENTDLV